MTEWANVLADIGIIVPIDKDQFTLQCPFHEDTVDSCSINTEKGVWICFAGCGQGTLYGFLMKYLGISYEEATQKVLTNTSVFNLNMFDGLIAEDSTMPEVQFPFKEGYVPEWIFDRGFNKSTLQKWGCGIDSENSLIIPIQDAVSRLVGWVRRRQYMTPKYLYSKGLKKSRVLFGQHLITDHTPFVCITEGTLDTMWLDQCGFSSVALLGASLSKAQEELTLGLQTEELVLCLDNDEAGQIGFQKAMACLSRSFVVSYIKLPREYKDVQDVRNSDELTSIINMRTFF
tara:strand:- start:1142 stop:2005 length:864 start_codon:yes stop_codon:yes gene_type:complete